MKADDLLTLVEYNRWADGRLLRQVKKLTSEQLLSPCWLSQGNLLDTLIHILDAQWYWRLACQEGNAPVERLKAGYTRTWMLYGDPGAKRTTGWSITSPR